MLNKEFMLSYFVVSYQTLIMYPEIEKNVIKLWI